MIAPLLKVHLRSQVSEQTHACLRRLLTALIHHCKGAEGFIPVSELLVEKFISTTRCVESNEHTDTLNRLIEIIAIVSSVRHGSRITGRLLSTFLHTTSDMFTSRSTVYYHYNPLVSSSAIIAGEILASC